MRLKELALTEHNKVICVMGGAASLAEELEGVQADVYISVNGHGGDLKPCKYAVAMDLKHTKTGEWMREVVRAKTDAPIAGIESYCDIILYGYPEFPRRIYSGLAAVWFAYALGAKMVIMAGFDGYNLKGDYMAKQRSVLGGVKTKVRTTNKNMQEHIPAYDPAEVIPDTEPAPELKTIKAADGMITVVVDHPTNILGVQRVVGEKVTAHRHEVRLQLKHKMVREV